MSRVYNLFISHSWSYSDDYTRLIQLLRARPYFDFKNYSVPRNDPIHNAPNSQALYNAIKTQMTPCHVVLILAGKYATFSTWINKEIHIAKNEFITPKPILAVVPFGSQQISSVVQDNATLIVKWSTDSIVDGIQSIAI
jgi:hypothetical protein